jgi:hypothetical protein
MTKAEPPKGWPKDWVSAGVIFYDARRAENVARECSSPRQEAEVSDRDPGLPASSVV